MVAQRTAVGAHDALHDGEPEPRPRGARREKWAKDAVRDVLGHSGSVIADREPDPAAVAHDGRDAHGTFPSGRLERVRHEIDDGLTEQANVAPQRGNRVVDRYLHVDRR